jgi:transcriptional regulator with XRE-family HTH domain
MEYFNEVESKVIAQKVHKFRLSHGLTLSIFSFVMGVPQETMAELETGNYRIGHDVVEWMSSKTGNPVEWFTEVN